MCATQKRSWLLASCAAALVVIGATAKSASAAQGTALFEDLWPQLGDLDFNDQVVAYNFNESIDTSGNVTGIHATFNVLAIGASIHNGLYLHLPVPSSAASNVTLDLGQGGGPVAVKSVGGESELVIPLVADTRSLFPGSPGGFINTDTSLPSSTASTISLNLQFATATALTGLAPFDIFIARTGTYGHQIHLPQFAGTDLMDQTLFDTADDNSAAGGLHFVSQNGLPFALSVPQIIAWPRETVPIDLAYPDIDKFFSSGGTQNTDWYSTNVNSQFLFSSVPEPSSLMLLAIGGTVLIGRRRAR